MLNKMKIVLAGAAAAAAMVSSAAHADTASATATVTILSAVDLVKYDDLNLGTIAASSNSGTVTLPTSSNTRVCAGVVCSGTAQRARFQVATATNGYVIAITHAPSVTLTHTPSGATMSLDVDSSHSTLTYNSTALEDIFVGGVLSVAANQGAGTYNGNITLNAEYQ